MENQMNGSRGSDPYAEALTQVLLTITDPGAHKDRLEQLSAARVAAKGAQDELAQAQEIANRREADLNARQAELDARERAVTTAESEAAQKMQDADTVHANLNDRENKLSLVTSALESETQTRQLAFKAQEESFAEHARLLASMQADLGTKIKAADDAKAAADAAAESHQAVLAKLKTILPA
jgi:chromosome segregation ATPase